MVSDATLRRKLQKKKKHKPYRKCPKCGNRMEVKLHWSGTLNWQPKKPGWVLYKECVKRSIGGCGYKEELFFTGGVTER